MQARDRWMQALSRDPRFAKALEDPRARRLVVRVLKLRGRAQGAFERAVRRVAKRLDLATQKDLRALHRRIRDLEAELRKAEERLIDAEDSREARDRTGSQSKAPRAGER